MGKRKPKLYWDNWDNLERELKIVVGKLKHFPTQKELQDMRLSSINSAISRGNYGSFQTIAERLGYEPNQRARGYWKKSENVNSALDELTKKFGHFPLYDEIKIYNSALLRGIEHHHGGYNKVRIKKGYPLSKKNRNYWDDEKNVLRELKKFMKKHKLNKVPDPDTLTELGASSIRNGIRKFGGFRHYRELFGEEQMSNSPGTWQSLDYCIQFAKDITKKHGFDFLPGSHITRSLGYLMFNSAIHRYHGGFPAFRERLIDYMGKPNENRKLEDFFIKYVGGENE